MVDTPKKRGRGVRKTPPSAVQHLQRMLKTVSRSAARRTPENRVSALKNRFLRGYATAAYTNKLMGRGNSTKHRRFYSERNTRIDYMPAAVRFSRQSPEQQAQCIRMVTTPVHVGEDEKGKDVYAKTLRIGRQTLAKRAAYAGMAPYLYAWKKDGTNQVKATHRLKPAYALTLTKRGSLKVNKAKLQEYIDVKRTALDKLPRATSRKQPKGNVQAIKRKLSRAKRTAEGARKTAVKKANTAAVAIIDAAPGSAEKREAAGGLLAATKDLEAPAGPRRSLRVRSKGK